MTLPGDDRANRLSTADLIPGVYLVSLIADKAETVNIRLLIVR